jgi:hypothetical protein
MFFSCESGRERERKKGKKKEKKIKRSAISDVMQTKNSTVSQPLRFYSHPKVGVFFFFSGDIIAVVVQLLALLLNSIVIESCEQKVRESRASVFYLGLSGLKFN